jgi:hypothetical protein
MGVYTIMFNTNGGTTYEPLTEQTEIPDLSEYTPTKALSYFAGWYYEADFQTKANQGDPLTEDITLYARWLNTAELLALLQEEKNKLTPAKLAKDFTAFGVTGILEEGGVDTSGANAEQAHVLEDKVFFSYFGEGTGTMPNQGAAEFVIETKEQAYVTIPEGYHNGAGFVKIDEDELEKIIEANIKAGVTILGQQGKNTVVDTEDANATSSDIKKDKTAYVNGELVVGTLDYTFSIELSQAEYDALGENWVPGITYMIIEEPEEEE